MSSIFSKIAQVAESLILRGTMRLHVYDIEGEILRALSSKPIKSRQVALYANQVLICKFIQLPPARQENLAMKRENQTLNL